MIKISKKLEEPTLLNLESINDDRGILIPLTDYVDDDLFKRIYLVENYGRGIIRGLHYHKKEAKLFVVIKGAAKFITLKLPEQIAEKNNDIEIKNYIQKEPTCIKTFVFSSRHHAILYVPTYYANGWIGLEDNTMIIGIGSIRWEEAKYDDIRINPYVIGKEKWDVIAR